MRRFLINCHHTVAYAVILMCMFSSCVLTPRTSIASLEKEKECIEQFLISVYRHKLDTLFERGYIDLRDSMDLRTVDELRDEYNGFPCLLQLHENLGLYYVSREPHSGHVSAFIEHYNWGDWDVISEYLLYIPPDSYDQTTYIHDDLQFKLEKEIEIAPNIYFHVQRMTN